MSARQTRSMTAKDPDAKFQALDTKPTRKQHSKLGEFILGSNSKDTPPNTPIKQTEDSSKVQSSNCSNDNSSPFINQSLAIIDDDTSLFSLATSSAIANQSKGLNDNAISRDSSSSTTTITQQSTDSLVNSSPFSTQNISNGEYFELSTNVLSHAQTNTGNRHFESQKRLINPLSPSSCSPSSNSMSKKFVMDNGCQNKSEMVLNDILGGNCLFVSKEGNFRI